MSKISLEPNASGAGTFTLAAPNSNTNRTLTLPDASGNIIAADASTGQFDSSNMPAGSVIQVVQGTDDSQLSTTSNKTYVSTPLEATITPSNSSNEVLASVLFTGDTTQASDGRISVTLFRNGVNVTNDQFGLAYNHVVNTDNLITLNVGILDAPNSTLPITYKLYFFSGNGEQVRIRGDLVSSKLTLMEIAG